MCDSMPTAPGRLARLRRSSGLPRTPWKSSVHQACSEAEAAALRRVAVLLATTDVALKIVGRAATPGSPAARLLKQRKAAALILDEAQLCPIETFCALGSRHDTVVAVGDRGQEVYPLAVPTGRVAGALPTQTSPSRRARRLPLSHCWNGHRLCLAHHAAR